MTEINRPATSNGLFVWVMHRVSQAFEERAVIKGGMALRLLDSPRSTTDIDYVFCPVASKKEILPTLRAILAELDGAQMTLSVHSTMIRAELRLDDAAIQVEASVAERCS